MRHRFTARQDDRIDRLIAAQTSLSRARARTLIRNGGVRVDGQIVREAWHEAPAGALVEVRGVSAPSDSQALPERYRDRWLLVVDKPSGLPSQAMPGGDRNHVYNIVSAREGEVGLLHRLDTPASGLLLLTLDRSVNAALSKDFQERRIRREYLAVVVGDPGPEGVWEAPLDGEQARTRWRRAASRDGLSVLQLRLDTGRTHQIRRHAADAGVPVVGDRRHGGAAGRAWPRLALHAWRMKLNHPVSGAVLELEAPIPDDLAALLERAGWDQGALGAGALGEGASGEGASGSGRSPST